MSKASLDVAHRCYILSAFQNLARLVLTDNSLWAINICRSLKVARQVPDMNT